MSQNYFFGADGEPLTGKNPLELRFVGQVTREAAAAAVQFANRVLADVRLGGLQQLRREVTLPDGTAVLFVHRFGTSVLTVTAPPNDPRKKEPFYGGILLQPSVYASFSDVFGPGAPDPLLLRSVAHSVTTAGKEPGKPGRPAVPGHDEGTDWLIMQVDTKRTMSSEPIKNGRVKFFRIKDPKFGPVVEHSRIAEKYLMSAKRDFSEFYLCGQRITSLPALPLTVPEQAWTLSCIRTYNFVPESFARAAKTKGIVIVAVDKKLFAINTHAPAPAWVLLTTATFDFPLYRANDFGTELTAVRLPNGSKRITCHGTNGAGTCSGFEITIAPATAAISGVLNLAHDGTVEAIPHRVTFTNTLRYDIYMAYDIRLRYFAGDPGPVDWPVTVKHGQSAFTYSLNISGGENALLQDRFLGGARPRYSAGGQTRTVSLTKVANHLGYAHAPTAGSWIDTPVFAVSYEFRDESHAFGATSDQRSSLISYSQTVTLDAASPTLSRSEAYARNETTTTALPFDSVRRYAYSYSGPAGEAALAWRFSATRTGTLTTYAPISLPARLNEFSDPLTDGPYNTLPATAETRAYSEASVGLSLIRRTGAEIVSWSDALSRFGTAPYWAAPVSVTTTRDPGPFPHAGSQYTLYGVPPGLNGLGEGVPLDATSASESWPGWFAGLGLSLYGSDDSWTSSSFPAHTTPVVGGGGVLYEFHDDVAVNQNTPSAMSPAALDSLQKSSPYADRVGDPDFDPSHPLPTVVAMRVPSATVEAGEDMSGVAPALVDSLTRHETVVHDPRTGGFVAESFWYCEHTPDTWRASLEVFLGNDHDVLPFRPVLNEWVALGTEDNTIKLKPVFAGKGAGADGFSIMGLI